MLSARRHRVFELTTGWWATTARMLALVLVLAVSLPVTGLAEDIDFHGGHTRAELTASLDAASHELGAKDPGLIGHLHCGCHVLAILDAVAPATVLELARPLYSRVSAVVSSRAPDRLRKPPRA